MLAKLVRLGRDAEVRYTPKGDPVASLAMVYDVGFGDSKRGQWIDGTLWGKRAESLGPYLTKGTQVVLYADDVELEQFMKKDGRSEERRNRRRFKRCGDRNRQFELRSQQGLYSHCY